MVFIFMLLLHRHVVLSFPICKPVHAPNLRRPRFGRSCDRLDRRHTADVVALSLLGVLAPPLLSLRPLESKTQQFGIGL